MLLKTIVGIIFSFALFINALLFLPQAVKLWRTKNADNVSLTTFVGFWFIIWSAVLYGYFDEDYILFYGYMLSVVTCGLVILLIVYYRFK